MNGESSSCFVFANRLAHEKKKTTKTKITQNLKPFPKARRWNIS